MSVLLLPEAQNALKAQIAAAPHGLASLRSLPDELIMRMLTHPDSVRIIWTTRYTLRLNEVDEQGYEVHDRTFTYAYRVIEDPSDPDRDLSVPGVRPMLFGGTFFDYDFLEGLRHGDHFYITYGSGQKLPRVLMVAVLDPTIRED